ncbi:MAG TPA: hypothetical protein K8V90_08335 [Romboutsia timonensis]|uniref:Uncharacterized protein n=1 Tax=Romboutsia timonensis TaxID=1776391 RepID=A0A921SZU6_9FIRM|nr:hypothetical protein [Clostridium perfringens]HJG97091.1 hypothetical protein [Romboutsia timonensis]
MSMLIRKKRLIEGQYNIQIVEIKDHVSKQNDEGLIIKFKIKGEQNIYDTRISKKATFLIDKLADVLCGEDEEISYEDAIGKECMFEIKINKDFINLVNISKSQDVELDSEDIATDMESMFSDDVDDIYENYDFPDFEDEDFLNFEEDEEDLV